MEPVAYPKRTASASEKKIAKGAIADIKKNIQEILFQLRNASKEAKQRKADSDWDQYRELRKGEWSAIYCPIRKPHHT